MIRYARAALLTLLLTAVYSSPNNDDLRCVGGHLSAGRRGRQLLYASALSRVAVGLVLRLLGRERHDGLVQGPRRPLEHGNRRQRQEAPVNGLRYQYRARCPHPRVACVVC